MNDCIIKACLKTSALPVDIQDVAASPHPERPSYVQRNITAPAKFTDFISSNQKEYNVPSRCVGVLC